MKALGFLALVVAAWYLLLRPKAGQAASPPESSAPDASQVPDSPDVPGPIGATYASTGDALDNIGQAIFNHEGPGLRDRNMNPGNIKSGGVFQQFGDWGDGWDALNNYITSHAAKHPDWDFYDFFDWYLRGSTTAPAVDGQGDSNAYAEYVANYAGFDPTQTLSSALQG